MFLNNIYGYRGSGKTYQLIGQAHQFLEMYPNEFIIFISHCPEYVKNMYERRFGENSRISFEPFHTNLRGNGAAKVIIDDLDIYLKRNNIIAYSMNVGDNRFLNLEDK